MSLQSFAKEMIQAIDFIPEQDKNLTPFLFLKLEARLEKLVQLLKDLLSSKTGENLENLEPFLLLLSDCWDDMQGKDEIYVHHPYTKTNRVFFMLAEKLSSICHEPAYGLLMPSLRNLDQSIQARIFKLKIHQFVFADNGIPIDVASCLDEAAQNKTTILLHTEGKKSPLNEDERKRVIHHSKEAFYYYEAIEYHVKKYPVSFEFQKKEFHEAIQKETYQVTASYGESGAMQLFKDFFPDIHFNAEFNQHQLIELMTNKLPKEKWQDFLDEIGMIKLKTIILEGDLLHNCVQRKKYYSGDDFHDQAILFCFTEIYWCDREKQDKHTSKVPELAEYAYTFLGGYGSRLKKRIEKQVGGHEKELKEKAVLIWKAFLLSDRKLSELEDYLKENQVEKAIKDALFTGQLGEIVGYKKWMNLSPVQEGEGGLLSYFKYV